MSDLNFLETNPKVIYENLIQSFENAYGETFYPADERRIYLNQLTQVLVSIYNLINDSAKQNLLRYARGPVLDAIGEGKDTPRLKAEKAICTVEFKLSNAQNKVIVIPKGTRVTPDGQLFFEIIKDESIEIGALEHSATVMATESGEKYNNFSPGQIKVIVDPIPYVNSVSNTSSSYGGSDIEPDDDGINIWSGYRERIRFANSKVSTAGHELGYKYWAKTSDKNIGDVEVTSPNPGEILLTILMNNGSLPTQEVLNKVESTCNGKSVRPQTDRVTVSGPIEVNYDITVTYYISLENELEESTIKVAVEEAVLSYISWQDSKLGRDINPDELRKKMLNAGAYRIEITSPAFTEVEKIKKAKLLNKNILYGGMK